MVSIEFKMTMIIAMGSRSPFPYARTDHREYVVRSERVKGCNFDVWKREVEAESKEFY